MSYQLCPTAWISNIVDIVRGCHLGANKNHTHEDQSNEERFDKDQAPFKDQPCEEPSSKSQSLSEGQSTEERFKEKKPLSILDLPLEIVNEIGSHLSVLSQACLLLTCKRLYHLFSHVLNDPAFRFPYSDGLDNLDLSIRTDLLLKLESERWKYCAACLKLHPLADFDPTSRGYENPTRRFCQWPGIIVFCPCLKVRLKRFLDLKEQHIPIWHQCQYSDPSDGVSYKLSISLSVKRYGAIVFNFQYFIHVDPTNIHRARRRIMFCPHKDALKQIKFGTTRAGSKWTELKKSTKSMKSMDCSDCDIHPDVMPTNDGKTYDIEFTRELDVLGDMWKSPPFEDDEIADYNWRRYSVFHELLAHSIINRILGVKGLSSSPHSIHRATLACLTAIVRRQEGHCYHVVHTLLNTVRGHFSVLPDLALLLLLRYMANGTRF